MIISYPRTMMTKRERQELLDIYLLVDREGEPTPTYEISCNNMEPIRYLYAISDQYGAVILNR